MKPWRKVVRRKTVAKEHLSVKRKGFTWWKTFSTTVSLECGHSKVYQGDSWPQHKSRCKECPDL